MVCGSSSTEELEQVEISFCGCVWPRQSWLPLLLQNVIYWFCSIMQYIKYTIYIQSICMYLQNK